MSCRYVEAGKGESMQRRTVLCLLISAAFVGPAVAQQGPPLGFVSKLGMDMDVRVGRVLANDVATGQVILPDLGTPSPGGGQTVPQIQLRGGNLQLNDPGADFTQIFSGFRPFVRATQSEVSAAAFGRNIVVTYNDSTGLHVKPNPSGPGLVTDRVLLSGFATSNDGGKTWSRGFIPPAAGAAETFGDPSVGVDRHGVFYFANLAADATHGTIQVNKSTDGGKTWGPGVVVQEDDGSDKEWLAVGRDPVVGSRDNVYVTWTSFQDDGSCQLRFGRSTDGGATFTAKTIYVPTADPNPVNPQNCLQFSNPVVDPITGTLYVPFLHFSNADQDFIQMLISDDAGGTFHFATFNVPGAPDPTVMPVTQPGELTSCGGSVQGQQLFVNLRLTVHGAADAGPGLFGLPRYINASRMVLQPALAARNGVLYLAWNNSTSRFFGDPAGGSNILFVRSDDGGSTWTVPIIVNPVSVADKHHVLPSLAIDADPNDVHVSYYTQHSDGSLDLDMANSHDGGDSFPADRTLHVTSTPFDLPPTNIPLSNGPVFGATNYDRQIAVCYALGEYQSVTSANGSVYAGWGDMRNTITEPTNALDPISGQTHPQEDVFYQKVKAQ
jgi:hypothetical protein